MPIKWLTSVQSDWPNWIRIRLDKVKEKLLQQHWPDTEQVEYHRTIFHQRQQCGKLARLKNCFGKWCRRQRGWLNSATFCNHCENVNIIDIDFTLARGTPTTTPAWSLKPKLGRGKNGQYRRRRSLWQPHRLIRGSGYCGVGINFVSTESDVMEELNLFPKWSADRHKVLFF